MATSVARAIQIQDLDFDTSTGEQALANTLANLAQEQRRRQDFVDSQILKQRQDRAALFGSANDNLTELYSKFSNIPTEVMTQKIQETKQFLAQNQDDPNFQAIADKGMSDAYQFGAAWTRYIKESDQRIKELTGSHNVLPSAALQWVNQNMYSYKMDPATNKVVATLRNPLEVDATSELNAEVLSHLNKYVDRDKLLQGAMKEIDNDYKTAPVKKNEQLTDKTGVKTLKLGTQYSLTGYDGEKQTVDKETGIPYNTPYLKTEPYVSKSLSSDGKPLAFEVLPEQSFNFLTTGKPSTSLALEVLAMDDIENYNVNAMVAAGLDQNSASNMALTISPNTFPELKKKFPSLINPYDPVSSAEFKRKAGLSLLKNTQQYDDKNEGVAINKSSKADAAKPAATKSTDNVPATDKYGKSVKYMLSSGPKSIGQFSDKYIGDVLTDVLKSRVKDADPAEYLVRIDGDNIIFDKKPSRSPGVPQKTDVARISIPSLNQAVIRAVSGLTAARAAASQ